MRDDHLIVEKIDLSLERRQVALLAAVALVLLGGIFALGVLVGRQLAVAALSSPRPAGDLAALDAQRDDAQMPVKAASLAAPKPAPAAAPPKAAPPPAPAVEVQAAPAEPAEEARAGKPVAIKPAAKVATIAAPKPARASGAAPLGPPPQNLGAFTVQLGASQDQAEARKLEARARGAGLRAYIVEANLGAKGVWYRVRAGAFPSREAADRYRRDVERELRGTAVVMPSR